MNFRHFSIDRRRGPRRDANPGRFCRSETGALSAGVFSLPITALGSAEGFTSAAPCAPRRGRTPAIAAARRIGDYRSVRHPTAHRSDWPAGNSLGSNPRRRLFSGSGFRRVRFSAPRPNHERHRAEHGQTDFKANCSRKGAVLSLIRTQASASMPRGKLCRNVPAIVSRYCRFAPPRYRSMHPPPPAPRPGQLAPVVVGRRSICRTGARTTPQSRRTQLLRKASTRSESFQTRCREEKCPAMSAAKVTMTKGVRPI